MKDKIEVEAGEGNGENCAEMQRFTLFPPRRVSCTALMRLQTLREARWIFAVLAAITILLGWLHPVASLPGVALILYTFYFFRDPDRAAPADARPWWRRRTG